MSSVKEETKQAYINRSAVVKQVAQEDDSVRLVFALDGLEVAAHVDIAKVLIDNECEPLDPVVGIDILRRSVRRVTVS